MQPFINMILSMKTRKDSHIFSLLPVGLSNVPFHEDTPSITRYFAENFPLHLAVHEVSPVLQPPTEYTQPHVHEDRDEINIIVARHKLLYKICLGNDDYTLDNNSAVWIPRGMRHSANVLYGSGFFITLQLR